MTNTPQCYACLHFDWDAPPRVFRCAAFPDGIPVPIQANQHDHSQPYPGDRGIRYEPIGPGPRAEVSAQAVLEGRRKSGPQVVTASEPRKPRRRRRAAH